MLQYHFTFYFFIYFILCYNITFCLLLKQYHSLNYN